MADDPEEIARIVAEQHATPEDLKPQAAPAAPEPEPAPVEAATPEPAAEAEVPETPAPEEQPKPKKKTAADHLAGRVGSLQHKLNEESAAKAALQARLDAAEALLSARGAPTDAAPPATPPAPANGRAYTPEEFQAAVKETARLEALNQKANAVYDAGTKDHTDFAETVATLNALGVMSQDFVEATLAAAGDEKTSAAVFHKLGADVEEAQRIAQLTPVRMGVELAKLAAAVSQPAQQRVSAAPAPIPTIRGPVNPVVDYARLAESDDMSAYAAARAAAGDPYALTRRQRAQMARNT